MAPNDRDPAPAFFLRVLWTPGAPRCQPERRFERFRSSVNRCIYVPACVVVLVGVLLVVSGWSTGWGGGNFAGSLHALRVVVLGPVSLTLIGLILVLERVRPAQRRPLVARGHRHDALYALLHMTLVVPLITALTLSFVEVTKRTLPWIVLPKMELLPRSLIIAVLLVTMDACNWLVHLANHRSRVLWRFHELHHSQEDLNALSVFRTHPAIHLSYLLALIPGTVLLTNGALPTTLLIAYGAMVAFAHSNTDFGFGPLGRVFVSPNYHRIHHRLDGAQDVNLGFTLTIWDKLVHRAVFPTSATLRIDTGLPGRPLCVEQASSRPRHLAVLAAQLAGPFRPAPASVELHQGTYR